jgi:hypothetical protein
MMVLTMSSTAFIAIAKTFDDEERSRREAAARKLQRAYRLGFLRFSSATQAIESMRRAALERRVTEAARNRQRSLVTTSQFVKSLGVVSVVMGVTLWSFTFARIRSQEKECKMIFGPIHECMNPRVYFAKGGLFGVTDCGLPLVTAINCKRCLFGRRLAFFCLMGVWFVV